MAAGQQHKKVAAVIQARMLSTRFPGKVIKPLPFLNGKILLDWIIDEIKLSKEINDIVLVTSEKKENDILEEVAARNKIKILRGSEDDVLSRFVTAAEKYEFDTIIRITADNPLLDIKLLDNLIQRHIKNNNDFTYSTHLPYGMNFEIMKGSALSEFDTKTDLTAYDKEHVTYYFMRPNLYRVEAVSLSEDLQIETIRLTVDTPADYAALCIVLSISIQTGMKGMELVNFINANYPWIWEINSK